MLALIEALGAGVVHKLESVGDFTVFALGTSRAVGQMLLRPRDLRLLPPQVYAIGAGSVPMIALTGLFVGMALAVSSYPGFAAYGLEERIGGTLNAAVVREIGPVLAATMLAGRIGGALTAELGTMRVTEQIDALRAMGSDPMRYLVAPRFFSCFVLIPFLTAYTDATGIAGGYFVIVNLKGVSSVEYIAFGFTFVEVFDVAVGLVKSMFFGATIGLVSCYKGFTCRQGAEGVGRAATEAFVLSFGLVLFENLLLSVLAVELYNGLYGARVLF